MHKAKGFTLIELLVVIAIIALLMAIFMDYHVRSVGLKELFTVNWHRGYNRANIWTKAGGVRAEDGANVGSGWLAQFKDY